MSEIQTKDEGVDEALDFIRGHARRLALDIHSAYTKDDPDAALRWSYLTIAMDLALIANSRSHRKIKGDAWAELQKMILADGDGQFNSPFSAAILEGHGYPSAGVGNTTNKE